MQLKNYAKDLLPQLLVNNWRWSLLLVLTVLLVFTVDRNPLHRRYITSDGNGYYSYLPAFFIYRDLHFNFIDSLQKTEAQHTRITDDFRRKVEGGVVNITYVGVSILWIPFFLGGHCIALLTPHEANGFSTPYQLSILIAAIFYLMLGLWAFGRLLGSLFSVKPWVISICLFGLVFATSSIYYITDEPSFTHIYSMSLFSIFLLYVHRFLNTYRTKHLWIWVVALALIGLVRPTNAIMIPAIPIAAGSWDKLKSAPGWVLANPFRVILPGLTFFAILSIQPVIYYLQTGSFFVWSYQGVSFNFGNPQILNILFSYQKGLFVYTPLLLFSLIGFWYFFKANRFVFYWLLVSILVAIYIQASWWNWWFGMSFGHRAFIDFYPLFFLAIAYGISSIKREGLLSIVLFVSCVFLVFNQIQLKQYRRYIYYWLMDKEMYWRVFLRTTRPYYGIHWDEATRHYLVGSLSSKFPKMKLSIGLGYETLEERSSVTASRGIANTGVFSVKLDQEVYGKIIRMEVPKELSHKRLAILSHLFIQPTQSPTKLPVNFIIRVYRNNSIVHTLESSSRSSNQFPNQWNRLNAYEINGFVFEPGDTIQALIHNPHGNIIYWDDFSLFLYGENDDTELTRNTDKILKND